MICRARQRPGATAWPWAPLAEASGYQVMTEALVAGGLGRGDAVYTMAFRRLPRFSTTDNFDEAREAPAACVRAVLLASLDRQP